MSNVIDSCLLTKIGVSMKALSVLIAAVFTLASFSAAASSAPAPADKGKAGTSAPVDQGKKTH